MVIPELDSGIFIVGAGTLTALLDETEPGSLETGGCENAGNVGFTGPIAAELTGFPGPVGLKSGPTGNELDLTGA